MRVCVCVARREGCVGVVIWEREYLFICRVSFIAILVCPSPDIVLAFQVVFFSLAHVDHAVAVATCIVPTVLSSSIFSSSSSLSLSIANYPLSIASILQPPRRCTSTSRYSIYLHTTLVDSLPRAFWFEGRRIAVKCIRATFFHETFLVRLPCLNSSSPRD